MVASPSSTPRRRASALRRVLPVEPELARRYDSAREQIVARVDAALFRRPDLGVLLGEAPSATVRELHRYLSSFFGSVFTLGLPEMIERGLPRVLSGYRNRGLPDDYFEVLPELWSQAIQDQLGPRGLPLSQVCECLGQGIDALTAGAVEPIPPASAAASRLADVLLSGDGPSARATLRRAVQEGTPVADVFVELVQPALYEIGDRWEQGRITAAQEHLASALVARVLANVEELLPDGGSQVAVVTTAPTETHEFGAWMVSDVLRSAGWTVRFLGSQLPTAEIVHYLRQTRPQLLALSVTLEIHLPSLKELIQAIREDEELASTPVLVGGQAFGTGDEIWRSTGADAAAWSAREVVEVAQSLVNGASPASVA